MNITKLKKIVVVFLMLAPSLLILFFLYIYPFYLSILTSFIDSNGKLNLQHYAYIFTIYKHDILFTIAICFLSTFLSLLISLVIASYIRLSIDNVFKKTLNSVIRFPLFVPMVVVAQMIRTFVAPHGFLNTMLAHIGVMNIDNAPNFLDWRGLLIGFLWKQIPFTTLIVLSGFAMINDNLIEAAKVVGASRSLIARKILVPMARRSIAIAFALTFASNMGTFTLPYMIIGGARPTTITVLMAHRVVMYGDWSVANALGVISYFAVGVFSIFYIREIIRGNVYEKR